MEPFMELPGREVRSWSPDAGMQTSTRESGSSYAAVTFGAVVAKKRGMFRGLFIGIDRYASDAITWLEWCLAVQE